MEEQEREGEDEDEDESGLECKSGASQCSRLSEAVRSPANAREGEAAQTTDRPHKCTLPPSSLNKWIYGKCSQCRLKVSKCFPNCNQASNCANCSVSWFLGPCIKWPDPPVAMKV